MDRCTSYRDITETHLKIALTTIQLITSFSSPDHKVLRESYCDSALSVMCHEMCVLCRAASTFYLVYALEATFLVR